MKHLLFPTCLVLPVTLLISFFAPNGFSQSLVAKKKVTVLDKKEFWLPELLIQPNLIPIENLRSQLPNMKAWDAFFARYGRGVVYIDCNNGTPASIMVHIPMVPGTGVDNHVTLEQLSAAVGYPVAAVTPEATAKVVTDFVRANQDVFRVDLGQLGAPTAQEAGGVWHVRIPQQAGGIPVRESAIAGSINSGNLVLIGLSKWQNVLISIKPDITAEQASAIGFEYAEGRRPEDQIWKEAALEIWPVQLNQVYSHRLVWVFGFRRQPGIASWEVAVDAHSGQLVAFRDVNRY